MIKKKELNQQDKETWENYIKDPSDIFDKEKVTSKNKQNRYRYKFLVKADKTINIQKFIENWISDIKKPNSIRLLIDIDPYNFL